MATPGEGGGSAGRPVTGNGFGAPPAHGCGEAPRPAIITSTGE